MKTNKQIDKLNEKVNDLIEKFEVENNIILKITIYNGDKFYDNTEYEGDKILLEQK